MNPNYKKWCYIKRLLENRRQAVIETLINCLPESFAHKRLMEEYDEVHNCIKLVDVKMLDEATYPEEEIKTIYETKGLVPAVRFLKDQSNLSLKKSKEVIDKMAENGSWKNTG